MEAERKLIVGLGNPGAEYAGTRHNVGFEVIEVLARRHGIPLTARRNLLPRRNFKAVYSEGSLVGQRAILARPMTYMNLSGEAVAALAHFYKIAPQDILVILDDVAIPLGQIRLRYKGSAGGHNGLSDILARLHTQEVPRLRIGVGAAKPGDMIGHVLSRFRKEELPTIQAAYETAADAIECALTEGFEMAMNRFNLSPKPADKPVSTPDDTPPTEGAEPKRKAGANFSKNG